MSKPEYNITEERMAVLNTCHLNPDNVEKIKSAIEQDHVIGYTLPFGFLIYCQEVHPDEKWGEFPELAFICGFLEAKGFVWVLFDRDAPSSTMLPSFDWS